MKIAHNTVDSGKLAITEINPRYQGDARLLSLLGMDLRHLRYFQAVAEELSYSRAARRLRVAQPALTRAIQEIEAQLNAPVLERTRHYVRLTPAGTTLLRESSLLLERWDESLARVRRTAAGEEGELRLGYIGPPTQLFLGRLLAEYRGLFPKVSLHLEERTPERVWEMVAKGRLSMALTRPVALSEGLGLRTLLLREERLGVALRPDHPLAGHSVLPWTSLTDTPLLVLARREGIGLHDAVLAGCRNAGFAPRISHSPSLIGTVLLYAEAGLGLAVVTDSVVPEDSPLQFIPLTPVHNVPLVLVWQEDQDPPPARHFRALVTQWRDTGRLWASG